MLIYTVSFVSQPCSSRKLRERSIVCYPLTGRDCFAPLACTRRSRHPSSFRPLWCRKIGAFCIKSRRCCGTSCPITARLQSRHNCRLLSLQLSALRPAAAPSWTPLTSCRPPIASVREDRESKILEKETAQCPSLTYDNERAHGGAVSTTPDPYFD